MAVSNEKYFNGCMHLEVCCSTKLCILAMGSLYFISAIFNHMIFGPFLECFLCFSVGRICEINKNPEFSRPKQKLFFSTIPSCALQCWMPENLILQMKQLQAIVILCKYNDFETTHKDHLCYDKPPNIPIKLHDEVHPPRDSL